MTPVTWHHAMHMDGPELQHDQLSTEQAMLLLQMIDDLELLETELLLSLTDMEPHVVAAAASPVAC